MIKSLQNYNSLSCTMKPEETSTSNIDKSFQHMQIKQSLATTHGYNPIEDLNIQLNKNDPQDEQ